MIRKLEAAWFLARHPEKSTEILLPHLMSYPQLREAIYRYTDWRDRKQAVRPERMQVPPASLRFRVHGDLSEQSFLDSGRQCSLDIQTALARAGREIQSFERILDFGCGCGRTLIWMPNLAASAHIFGSDIDPEVVDWCRRSLGFAQFSLNQDRPPLSYPDSSFDLIYAISVFTHLNEAYQFEWLSELRRISQPGGYVLISVHGAYYWDQMPPEQAAVIQNSGFHFVRGPKSMDGIFPDWYQTAFHTPQYVAERYSQYFDIVDYLPSGLDHCQDIAVLQKRR